MGTAATPIESVDELNDPGVVKVVWDMRHRALYFSRSVIPFVRDGDMEGKVRHWRHLGLYAYRGEFLRRLVEAEQCVLEQSEKLEQLRALHLGAEMVVLEVNERGIGVDTPEDVRKAELLLQDELREAGLEKS
jgi:3-deoxy-manno-octulosonate cytidylyltransferase (CMP-KDO synthetase)